MFLMPRRCSGGYRGRVAERGTHHDLMLYGGRYAELWAAQAERGDGPEGR